MFFRFFTWMSGFGCNNIAFQPSFVEKIVVSHIRVTICHFLNDFTPYKICHCHMNMSWLCMKNEVQVKHIITPRLVLRRRQKWAHKCFPPTRSGNEIKTWRWCHAISTQNKHKHLRTKISDSVMNRTSSQKHLWIKSDPRFSVCIISYFPKPDGRLLFEQLSCSKLSCGISATPAFGA